MLERITIDPLSPREIALRAQIAALLEVSAPKPGNVGRYHDFGDTSFEDFLLSAAAMGEAVGEAGSIGVGAAVSRAITETQRWVRTNTNLGIVLLFVPLASAAARDAGDSLRARLSSVLAGLTVADAEAAYAAIRIAKPGGLGSVPEQDVHAQPTVTLRAAMALAADRDSIAREYVSDYATTFETAVPALRRARERGDTWPAAITETFLTVLAALPDSLIARKFGTAVAQDVSSAAAAVLARGEADGTERRAAIDDFDRMLRAGNGLNPGTTADLVAAAIFVVLLEAGPSGQE